LGAPAGPAGGADAFDGPFLPFAPDAAALDRAVAPARGGMTGSQPAVATARGLRKSFGAEPVVRGLDLEVGAGQCFGLLGPNGAGKPTTLKLLLGLSEPDAGETRLLAYPVPQRAREARRQVGVVPQFD